MSDHSVKPEDILADGVDYTVIKGVPVRKGTVAAFIANIQIIEDPDSSDLARQNAWKTMKNLAPTLVATGLTDHVLFKNPNVERMLQEIISSKK
ncbi:hypothetical protein [Legionella sp. 16cNR16C]|uniref:hypothetical protein n=1 Tax=Legionella sp. 16cNR16C TaxID=2905656 RepID=UPI001E291E4C|nr:hypothetical protein [Legionella sp. 16cNR16C]MCE3043464.1 hypothetical protein [Legionella sp. 16cNR16C]